MDKPTRKVKLIYGNVLVVVSYYSNFNTLYSFGLNLDLFSSIQGVIRL